MGHYDNCRKGNCSKCGQAKGYCVHTQDTPIYETYGSELAQPNSEISKRLQKAVENFESLKKQIDGDHYKGFAIQPAEYSYRNKLGWHEGEIVKYVTRHKLKNGKRDLEKAIHLLEMLIELEYDSA